MGLVSLLLPERYFPFSLKHLLSEYHFRSRTKSSIMGRENPLEEQEMKKKLISFPQRDFRFLSVLGSTAVLMCIWEAVLITLRSAHILANANP